MSPRSAAIGLLLATGLALGGGCLHPASNPTPDAGVCALGGGGYAPGAPDPQNPCRSCQPLLSESAFSPVAEGTSCGPDGGSFCHAGGCRAGCFIGGTFHAEGEEDPARACQACDPLQSLTAWSRFSGPTSPERCGRAQVCFLGACTTGCFIDGTALFDADSNPDNGCETCNSQSSTSTWSDLLAGSPCGDGGQCNAGRCEFGCNIGEALFPPDAPDPTDPCRSCQPKISSTGFSPFSGVPLSPCAGGQVCYQGTCATGCWINGSLVPSGAVAQAPPCLACLPDQNPRDFSPFTGDPRGTCRPGEVCELGACRAGCFIDGGYLATGALQAGNAALCCGPSTSTSDWTPALLPGKAYPALGGNILLTGDIDGDGFTDLVSAGYSTPIEVFFGDGNGGLRMPSVRPSVVLAGWSVSGAPLALGDLNGDGLLDLVLGIAGDGGNVLGVSFFGDGGFVDPIVISSTAYPLSVAVADFNRDGHPDVAVAHEDGVQILFNQGDGTLTPGPSMAFPFSYLSWPLLAVADFDGDGQLDLAALLYFEAVIWFGDGTGGFPASAYSISTSGFPFSAVIGDLDGTGRLDLLSGSSDTDLLQRTRVGAQRELRFAGYSMPQPNSVALDDLNGDGLLDAVAGNDYSGALSVLINSDGGLQTVRALQIKPPTAYGSGGFLVATGRFQMAGGINVAVLNEYGGNDAGVVLYRNGCQ